MEVGLRSEPDGFDMSGWLLLRITLDRSQIYIFGILISLR
jgi:hypothetical protein